MNKTRALFTLCITFTLLIVTRGEFLHLREAGVRGNFTFTQDSVNEDAFERAGVVLANVLLSEV